jgi:hypothetical protein
MSYVRALLACIVLAGLCLGCVRLKGGRNVSRRFVPDEVEVRYRGEGAVPPNAEYQLVWANNQLAFFERSLDGSGTLMTTHWVDDDDADHFVVWITRGPAFEYVVPYHRDDPAERFVYPAGLYEIVDVAGVMRPIPLTRMDPVATLYPHEARSREHRGARPPPTKHVPTPEPVATRPDDIVFLVGGGRVRGRVMEDDDRGVSVLLADGSVRRVTRQQVMRIEYVAR